MLTGHQVSSSVFGLSSLTVSTGTSSARGYASAVVGEVTKHRPRAWLWTGATTSIVRWGDMFLPRTFWV